MEYESSGQRVERVMYWFGQVASLCDLNSLQYPVLELLVIIGDEIIIVKRQVPRTHPK